MNDGCVKSQTAALRGILRSLQRKAMDCGNSLVVIESLTWTRLRSGRVVVGRVGRGQATILAQLAQGKMLQREMDLDSVGDLQYETLKGHCAKFVIKTNQKDRNRWNRLEWL